MVAIPIGIFYLVYSQVFRWKQEGLAWSGIAAVIATNMVIASYVYMAWNEDDEEEPSRSKNRLRKNTIRKLSGNKTD
jgi:hypothetical protein